MASFGQYPPQSSFIPPPNQVQPPPPPPPPQVTPQAPPQLQGNQYTQNWRYSGGDGSVPPPPSQYPPTQSSFGPPNSSFHHAGYASSAQQHYAPPPPPSQHMHPQQQQQPPQQQQQYPYPPPPPPPDSSYPPPPPPSLSQNSIMQPQPPSAPPPMYYPSSQYNQFSHQPLPPPPPSSPPPSSSIPPPPPPSSPPPPPSSIPPVSQSTGSGLNGKSGHKTDRGPHKDFTGSGRRESGHSNQGHPPPKHQKPPLPKSNGPSGRVETEEERRLRKKREMEKQRQEEKHKQQLKESQNNVLQKSQILSSGLKGHGSILGTRIGERTSSSPLLSGERIENRLKKPTTFLCRMKFRNELPDPSSQPKLMALPKDKDRYTKYAITSLEKTYKPELYVDADLGIPLDLLDLSVYNPPKEVPPLVPEDEELVRDDEAVTPVKKEGIRRKERPTDKGVSWLVKTQYISPLSNDAAKQSLTEKQAKELRERRGGGNILENNRERKIQQIVGSFEASKSRPVHATNKKLVPKEVMPLFPDFDRYDDQFVVATFDGAPTADSEFFGKLDGSARDAHESRAIMKSFKARGSDQVVPDNFLAYMVPALDELPKDMHDESEDISYSWVREYHWDVRGEDVEDPTTYIVSFDEGEARYAPLPTKLILRKRRSKEGRSGDDAEQFPVPATVTVRKRSIVSAIELNDVSSNAKGNMSNLKREGLDIEDGLRRSNKVARHSDMDQSSGAEDDVSE